MAGRSGEAGVTRALEILRADVERTLAAGVRFDRRVGSFVRERSSKLVSRLNSREENTLAAANGIPTSQKQIASLQSRMRAIRTAFQTIREHIRQTRPGSLIEMMADYIQADCDVLQ